MKKGSKQKQKVKDKLSEDMKGNENALKWTEEKAIEIYKTCLRNVRRDKRGDFTSLHDVKLFAMDEFELGYSTFDYLVKTYPVLVDLKEAIKGCLISKINKSGLEGDYNATMCIWRMKQLGERDPDKQDAPPPEEKKEENDLSKLTKDELYQLITLREKIKSGISEA